MRRVWLVSLLAALALTWAAVLPASAGDMGHALEHAQSLVHHHHDDASLHLGDDPAAAGTGAGNGAGGSGTEHQHAVEGFVTMAPAAEGALAVAHGRPEPPPVQATLSPPSADPRRLLRPPRAAA
jgi:hypothetical protein